MLAGGGAAGVTAGFLGQSAADLVSGRGFDPLNSLESGAYGSAMGAASGAVGAVMWKGMLSTKFVQSRMTWRTKGLIENPNRQGIWGKNDGRNGRFREYIRFDKGQIGKPGWKGKDHIHLYGKKDHLPPDTPFDPKAPYPNE